MAKYAMKTAKAKSLSKKSLPTTYDKSVGGVQALQRDVQSASKRPQTYDKNVGGVQTLYAPLKSYSKRTLKYAKPVKKRKR